jgi:2-polyprenyl-3-methyl-5-hydroxy-6-metoxy-1,4-benzoquinol methylase
MTEDTRQASDDAAFAARRAAARQRLDALDPAKQGRLDSDIHRHGWFTAVYDLAAGDPASVPWADLAPHPLTSAWVAGQGAGLKGRRVLDVGCGLGDNAECFAAAGADVTAFDLVPRAIEWAKARFPAATAAYRAADLFDLPTAWQGRFDLVHECYTLQALAPALQGKARDVLADLLKPGGKLLVIARARDEDAPADGPPWRLPPSFFATWPGMRIERMGDVVADGARHWQVELTRSLTPAASET